MFGLSLTHLILFAIILIIFVGPEQLPEVARTIGRLLNEFRRATQEFQGQFTGQFTDEKRAMDDLKNQIQAPVKHSYEIEHKNTDDYSVDAPPVEESTHSAAVHAGDNEARVPTSSEDREKKS